MRDLLLYFTRPIDRFYESLKPLKPVNTWLNVSVIVRPYLIHFARSPIGGNGEQALKNWQAFQVQTEAEAAIEIQA